MLAFADDLDRFGYTSIPAAEQTAYLDRASTIITGRTGLRFEAGSAVVELALGDKPLRLPQQPVTAVNSVVITAYPVAGLTPSSAVLPSPTAWTGWSLVNGEIHGLPPVGPWSYRLHATVDFDYGYATIPDDVIEACCRIADTLYAKPTGLRARAVDDYSESFDQDSTAKDIQAVIDELRSAYLGDVDVVTMR